MNSSDDPLLQIEQNKALDAPNVEDRFMLEPDHDFSLEIVLEKPV
jgi:hypothetical protein